MERCVKIAGLSECELADVIKEYGDSVYAMARRVVIDPRLAEEVAQDTFLALWQRPEIFHPERGPLIAFLLGVARKKAIDVVRREETVRRTTQALVTEMGASTTPQYVDGSIEDRQLVQSALARLSHLQRESIFLAYFGGRTYRGLARELGIPEGTAKTRIRDGLIRLREILGSTSEHGSSDTANGQNRSGSTERRSYQAPMGCGRKGQRAVGRLAPTSASTTTS
jgi:RNA polymerase sigma-70 factor (ECF subfamily)